MAHENTKSTAIDLRSLVESHENPFVVIDHDYHILAINTAYEQVYGTAHDSAVGKFCYSVSHGNDKPCDLMGEDCPPQERLRNGRDAYLPAYPL